MPLRLSREASTASAPIQSKTSAPSRTQSADALSFSEAEILRFDVQFSKISANDEDFVLFDFDSGKVFVESNDEVTAASGGGFSSSGGCFSASGGGFSESGASGEENLQIAIVTENYAKSEVKGILRLKENRHNVNHLRNLIYFITVVICSLLLIIIPLIFIVLQNV